MQNIFAYCLCIIHWSLIISLVFMRNSKFSPKPYVFFVLWLLAKSFIFQSNIIPDFNICYVFLKDAMISSAGICYQELKILKDFSAQEKKKKFKSFSEPNPGPCFLLLSDQLSQEGSLFNSISCLIPYNFCLFHLYVTFGFCLPLRIWIYTLSGL